MEGRSLGVCDFFMKRELLQAYLDHQIFRVLSSPITFASGILSPVYCDNRKILGFPGLRTAVLDGLLETVRPQTKTLDGVVGVATGGIAWAALLAHTCGLPTGYVRKETKAHGTKTRVEGFDVKSKKVLLFEDCLTTGHSAIDVLNILKEEGAMGVAVQGLFDYGFLSQAKRKNLCSGPWQALITFSELVTHMVETGQVSRSQFDALMQWHRKTEIGL